MPSLRRALTPKGTLVLSSGLPNPVIRRILTALVLSPFVSQRLVTFTQKASRKDLDGLTALVESGRIAPVMDRTFPLHEAAEALRYYGAGHARGKTVITI